MTIANRRIGINRLLEENPSFRAHLSATVANVYPDAVKLAAVETGIPRESFPAVCPFAIEQLLNEDFLPG